jgi:hypothetical protein
MNSVGDKEVKMLSQMLPKVVTVDMISQLSFLRYVETKFANEAGAVSGFLQLNGIAVGE